MGGGADKLIDGWVDLRTYGQTDKETGVRLKKDGLSNPPIAMGLRIKTIL